MAARLKKLVGRKVLMAFGIRRAHPALAPMLDRAAYIGGFDGVSSLIGAKTIDKKPMGTMPHSLIIAFGDQAKAWQAFDEVMPKDVPRIALVDTYYDEKTEALMAAGALGKRLHGIRLDTPGSRKGDLAEIIREVKWELDVRGHKHVKIFVSGGLNDKNIQELSAAGADGFGVGTSLSNAPTIDFAMDIVELGGKPVAKRGKLGGEKKVWRCEKCLRDVLLPVRELPPRCPSCGKKMKSLLAPLIKDGKIVGKLPSPDEIRARVLKQLERVMEV
jgi:nicotinate phosphoribosyltransferase